MKEGTLPGGGGPASAADTVDRTLREVRALIESTVAEHRARRNRASPVTEVGVEEAAVRAAAEQVAEQARRTVEVVLPAATGRTAPVHTAVAQVVAGLAPGIAVRALCAQVPPDWGGRGELRQARVPLPTLLIADGRCALACTDSAAGRQTSVVTDPTVVRALLSLFTSVWGGAVPVTGPFDFGSRARADMVRRVLERLRDGVTDEAAARDLAVSVRTYRRYVTGILEMLGANSRFQAGVRASELGILPGRG
ncbi:DNA-binding response regulator [Streptomyces sp. XD-27]|uniref:DNA-binding response regulator n=1 Tax=Streptomyces sp. XD-27 TaxID=3062779 RepID=UPI0026F40A4A|nr:DNA-binding response regulator [Streptomyces sp. XD-27]WKX70547.1 DNA-binding response regulator [Streptomyces sp. XD-27]